MNKIILLAIFVIISGCSSMQTTVVENKVKLDRVSIEQDEYERPQVYLGEFKFSKNYRKIASTGSQFPNSLSNRQLYFLSYYKQYKTLGKILGKTDQITSCPSFHSVVLDYEKELQASKSNFTTAINLNSVKSDYMQLTNYPVLTLPYKNQTDLYTELVNANWQNSNEKLLGALETYYQTEEKEIFSLCDTGVSPGYYVFENLVQYFKDDKSFHRSKDGLKALLKVPVITNMVILDNLKRDQYANNKRENYFNDWLMERSNISWFNEFKYQINQRRKSSFSALSKGK